MIATTARLARGALEPDAPASATARWRFGPDDGTVVASARSSTATPDGFRALAALRGALAAGGWRLELADRRLPGAVERGLARSRAKRRARIEHKREQKRARFRFWFLLLALIFLVAFLSLSIWEKIGDVFGL